MRTLYLEEIYLMSENGSGEEQYLMKYPSKRVWIDYDEKADVLHISFRKP
jgi:hypothetical protein